MNKFPVKIFLITTLIILSLILVFGFIKINSKVLETDKPAITQQGTPSTISDKFNYNGQTGIDALTLLKERAKVKQDNSGLVVSINGRIAESSNHEYWAFYINNKLSGIGPGDYKTSDSDTITWEIDKY